MTQLQLDLSAVSIINLVEDFNRHVIGIRHEELELTSLNEKQNGWYDKFVTEELTEYKEAVASQDIVGMCDAVGDLIYGAMGMFFKMGLSPAQVQQVFEAIHHANMSKTRGDKGRGTSEDAIKPANFVPPEEVIADILFGG